MKKIIIKSMPSKKRAVKVKISDKKIPKTLSDYPKLYKAVLQKTRKLSRRHLIIFWLSLGKNTADKVFNAELTRATTYSKEDIIGFLDEISREDAEKFLVA